MQQVALHGENKILWRSPAMSIEKKSLISTLKTTKKANAVKDDISGAASTSPAQKLANFKHANVKQANFKHANVKQANVKQANFKHANMKQANVKQANVKQAVTKGL
jgi:uncharacterized protein YjbI with pentapeptide repeats